MAITKNHPINATLKKAVDYICNPAKTDGTLLVYSYGCAPETADIEFEWTREKAREPGPHLARHLIQAFKPGETTPEQAHEIGKQLAEEVLGGKYEYVLTTHIDRGHIHNHIIFLTTSALLTSNTAMSTGSGKAASDVSATGCAGSTVCPSYRQMRIKAKAT